LTKPAEFFAPCFKRISSCRYSWVCCTSPLQLVVGSSHHLRWKLQLEQLMDDRRLHEFGHDLILTYICAAVNYRAVNIQ
jgi:hypothetical protein